MRLDTPRRIINRMGFPSFGKYTMCTSYAFILKVISYDSNNIFQNLCCLAPALASLKTSRPPPAAAPAHRLQPAILRRPPFSHTFASPFHPWCLLFNKLTIAFSPHPSLPPSACLARAHYNIPQLHEPDPHSHPPSALLLILEHKQKNPKPFYF